MDMVVDFPGGLRVDAHFGRFTVSTDQPVQAGGEDSAPTPFATFLASLATCAGIYVLGFCRQRDIPTNDIRLVQRTVSDPATRLVARIALEIQLPEGFPEKYRAPLIRAAEQCTVKKHFEHPPAIEVTTVLGTATHAPDAHPCA
jgi:putative redox protein